MYSVMENHSHEHRRGKNVLNEKIQRSLQFFLSAALFRCVLQSTGLTSALWNIGNEKIQRSLQFLLSAAPGDRFPWTRFFYVRRSAISLPFP